ncbi:hypothetical protein XELAEV_18033475mg [Xenopus laevis]|uniref:CCHC-type domain-containing protein n=1 Tax=Xenopus laevis TaxID=8355 RepID=A0A974HE12_XENLA|nr:hypothetical protein XELAEV_18033475mg [Xenopus laevis]
MKPELKTHLKINILPEDVSSWVQKHRPNTAEKVISLSEVYLHAKDAGRHTKRFQQPQMQSEMAKQKTKAQVKSDSRGMVCFECQERGHITKFCPKKIKRTSTHTSFCGYSDCTITMLLNGHTVNALLDNDSKLGFGHSKDRVSKNSNHLYA